MPPKCLVELGRYSCDTATYFAPTMLGVVRRCLPRASNITCDLLNSTASGGDPGDDNNRQLVASLLGDGAAAAAAAANFSSGWGGDGGVAADLMMRPDDEDPDSAGLAPLLMGRAGLGNATSSEAAAAAASGGGGGGRQAAGLDIDALPTRDQEYYRSCDKEAPRKWDDWNGTLLFDALISFAVEVSQVRRACSARGAYHVAAAAAEYSRTSSRHAVLSP